MATALTLFYSMRGQYVYRITENADSSSLATTFRICLQLIGRKLGMFWAQHQLLTQDSEDREDVGEGAQMQVLTERTLESHQEEEYQDELFAIKAPKPSTKATRASWTQQQMALEDAHQALRILPIMGMLPIFWMLYDQQGSVWTLQASRMALHGLQPEQINILNPLEIMVFIPLFDRIIYPALEARRVNIAPLRRMGWGMVLAALSFVISGFLEYIIENSPTNSVHIVWAVPQITILAIGEMFLSITGLEYAYSSSPDRLKGFIMATYLLTVAIGDLFGGLLYSSVFRLMNRAVVMYVCAALMLVNRFVFGRVIVATQQDKPAVPPTNDAVEEPYVDHPHETHAGVVGSGVTVDGSIEMIDQNNDAEKEREPGPNLLVGEGDEDWLNVEYSNLRVV
jgi:POT family